MLSTLRPFKITEPPAPERPRDGLVIGAPCGGHAVESAFKASGEKPLLNHPRRRLHWRPGNARKLNVFAGSFFNQKQQLILLHSQ